MKCRGLKSQAIVFVEFVCGIGCTEECAEYISFLTVKINLEFTYRSHCAESRVTVFRLEDVFIF